MGRTTPVAALVIFTLVACSAADTANGAASVSPSTTSKATGSPDSTSPQLAPSNWMPNDLAFGPGGNLYVSDCWRHRLYVVHGSTATIVAGTGDGAFSNGFSGDGGPATDAHLTCPFGIAFDQAGDLYVADLGNNRVRMITPSGSISTTVGSGPGGYEGDGGPATEAQLNTPTWLALDAAGNLYIVDRENDVIRMVGPDGIIKTVAGTGESGFSGDGGRADQARIDDPEGIAIDTEGNLVFGDANNARIRMIDREGMIRTIAGTGHAGYTGDGGPADQARIAGTSGLRFAPDGTLYFTQGDHPVIRAIDDRGVIRTVVGDGRLGCPQVGNLATNVSLRETIGLAIDTEGRLLFAVGDCGAVYRVNGDGRIALIAG